MSREDPNALKNGSGKSLARSTRTYHGRRPDVTDAPNNAQAKAIVATEDARAHTGGSNVRTREPPPPSSMVGRKDKASVQTKTRSNALVPREPREVYQSLQPEKPLVISDDFASTHGITVLDVYRMIYESMKTKCVSYLYWQNKWRYLPEALKDACEGYFNGSGPWSDRQRPAQRTLIHLLASLDEGETKPISNVNDRAVAVVSSGIPSKHMEKHTQAQSDERLAIFKFLRDLRHSNEMREFIITEVVKKGLMKNCNYADEPRGREIHWEFLLAVLRSDSQKTAEINCAIVLLKYFNDIAERVMGAEWPEKRQKEDKGIKTGERQDKYLA